MRADEFALENIVASSLFNTLGTEINADCAGDDDQGNIKASLLNDAQSAKLVKATRKANIREDEVEGRIEAHEEAGLGIDLLPFELEAGALQFTQDEKGVGFSSSITRNLSFRFGIFCASRGA